MNFKQSIKQWSDYQRTVRELTELDNRQLRDLGIARNEIKSLARARCF
jgi:uncharacterized protein YjiS (DUF1127 family)